MKGEGGGEGLTWAPARDPDFPSESKPLRRQKARGAPPRLSRAGLCGPHPVGWHSLWQGPAVERQIQLSGNAQQMLLSMTLASDSFPFFLLLFSSPSSSFPSPSVAGAQGCSCTPALGPPHRPGPAMPQKQNPKAERWSGGKTEGHLFR